METNINPYLKDFILNQRRINCSFRKATGINRTDLEILSFANTVISFNPYQVQQQFAEMNLQQVRLAIRKLVSMKMIEIWSVGARNKPAVYVIGYKGKQLLSSYNQAWQHASTTNCN